MESDALFEGEIDLSSSFNFFTKEPKRISTVVKAYGIYLSMPMDRISPLHRLPTGSACPLLPWTLPFRFFPGHPLLPFLPYICERMPTPGHNVLDCILYDVMGRMAAVCSGFSVYTLVPWKCLHKVIPNLFGFLTFFVYTFKHMELSTKNRLTELISATLCHLCTLSLYCIRYYKDRAF